jgi:uncharacterized protein (TIGR02444 family)
MNTPHASPPLWDFALAFYAQPSVAQTCLQLQDEYHANVCLLIGLHWLDAREQYLDNIEFTALKIHIQGWTQNVVEPLRSLRRRLKSPVESLVQDATQTRLCALIKQAELMAEKKLLIEIERWVELLPYHTNLQATTNLARYCAQLEAPQHLIEIVRADIRSE